MRYLSLSLVFVFLLLLSTFGFLRVARSQGSNESEIIAQETQGENTRQILVPDQNAPLQENSPNIGFIDSPSPTCYQPDPTQNVCYITWYYLSVSAAPDYMIAMTTTLNTIGVVAYTSGFFQTSMVIPYNMLGQGIKVPCGSLGSGGNPNLGLAYGYTIRARDSNGLTSANYGTIYCPAFTP